MTAALSPFQPGTQWAIREDLRAATQFALVATVGPHATALPVSATDLDNLAVFLMGRMLDQLNEAGRLPQPLRQMMAAAEYEIGTSTWVPLLIEAFTDPNWTDPR